MSQCILCQEKLSLLTQKKTMEGYICGKCAGRIPHVIHGDLFKMNLERIRETIAYEKNTKGKEFIVTASLGKLRLDEMHGRFAITDSIKSDGTLSESADIFDLLYLESIGIYPVNPRQNGKDIVCDVEFNCSFKYPAIKFKVTVCRNSKCDYKRINSSQVSWSEPGMLSMFRNMFDQAINTAIKKYLHDKEHILKPYDIDIMKARAALHVSHGYPYELIERQYQNLIKMYQEGPYTEEEKEGYITALNKYHDMLCHYTSNPNKR